MRVLSLGAGIQSTTLLLMAKHGDIEPIDGAIFADTQWETAATYGHLQRLVMDVGDDIPIYRVSAGNIREEAINKAGRLASMPAFVLNPNGTIGQLRRQCTNEYKLRVIKRKLRELGATAANPIDVLIGISWDEWTRVRDADVRYIHNVYPLIEKRLTRLDCEAWLTAHGYSVPPKSACIGCPFRGAAGFRELTESEREDANTFEEQMREQGPARFHGNFYLHPSLKPLRMIDFRSEQERGQMDMWDQECAGVCGV